MALNSKKGYFSEFSRFVHHSLIRVLKTFKEKDQFKTYIFTTQLNLPKEQHCSTVFASETQTHTL